ncbi:MAG: hypothetical protein Q8O19_07795, partial [Rectinemataceae bacterium]|nr:hypothetical protein [Rectinemataceae bacterium]
NIRLTRLNIVSNRLTLRMDAFWLDLVVPYCIRAFGNDGWLGGEVTTSYSSSMSRVEIPAQ